MSRWRARCGYKGVGRSYRIRFSSASASAASRTRTIKQFNHINSTTTTVNTLPTTTTQTTHYTTIIMPAASDYKGAFTSYSKVDDLPGAKLGEHLHHIFSGIKSRTATPSTSRNTSVAPSRAHSPVREMTKSTEETKEKKKGFREGGYYAF